MTIQHSVMWFGIAVSRLDPLDKNASTFSDVAVVAAQMVAMQGIDTAALFDAIGSFTTGTSGTAITLPAVTTTAADALLIGVATSDGGGGGATFTSSALTEFDDTNSVWGGSVVQSSAGSSGTKLVTASTSGAYLGVLVAYKSLAGGGGGSPAGRMTLLGVGC